LQNIIERAVILSQGPILELEPEPGPALAAEIPPATTGRSPEMAVPQPSSPPPAMTSTLETVERVHIMAVLRQTGGVIEGPKGAARILNLHPNTLRHRMKKLGIERTAMASPLAASR
jgi:formate hydrogenlyase transcriptional activator